MSELFDALEKAGHKVERIPLTPEQQERFEKGSKEFREWYNRRNPKYCSCGKKIKEHNLYINDVAHCEDCFHEATKHWSFR